MLAPPQVFFSREVFAVIDKVQTVVVEAVDVVVVVIAIVQFF